jgi:broad-specificity NMP kinase
MHLVFIYGPPGVGKLSVANELAALTGFKLLDNHLTVNVVASVFARESAAWFRLLRRIRRDIFAEITREAVDVVSTSVFRGTPEHVQVMRSMLRPVRAGGGTVVFVRLSCSREELFSRLQSGGRRGHQKLMDPGVLADLMDKFDLFASMPFQPTLDIDSTEMTPRYVARQIAVHYSLPLLSTRGGCRTEACA